MQALVSSLMAVLLLANAVVGCCRHAVLDCATADGFGATVAKAEPCCQHEPDEHGQPHGPGGCTVECYGACTYLPPERSDTDLADGVAPLDLVPLIHPLLTTGCDGPARPSAALPATGYSPPVRLHLLHQSLLV